MQFKTQEEKKEQRTLGQVGNKIVDLNPDVSIIALNVSKQVKGRECQAGYKSKT